MAGDVEPDWVDTSKIAIPQADEQQRLLANLVSTTMESNKKPIARFWYFPQNYKSAVVMSGDDHSNGGTPDASITTCFLAGCKITQVAVRAEHLIYPATPLTPRRPPRASRARSTAERHVSRLDAE